MVVLKSLLASFLCVGLTTVTARSEPDVFDILHAQRSLVLEGYQPGPVDGLWGPRTQSAIESFQEDHGLDEELQAIQVVQSSAFQRQLTVNFNERSETMEAEIQHLQIALDYDDARHLLERTGLGAHPREIRALVGLTRSAAVSKIIETIEHPGLARPLPSFLTSDIFLPYWMRWDTRQLSRVVNAAGNNAFSELQSWWIGEMISTTAPAREVLNLFWHNHFVAPYRSLDRRSLLVGEQHLTIRRLGTRNFRDLLAAMLRDPAILVSLDSPNNRRGQANENLARELVELFTMGDGQYDETDIREIARALTGHSINSLSLDFQFEPWAHDYGTKRILGAVGNFDGDDLPDIILRDPAVAELITEKFWSTYISNFNYDYDEISILSQEFRESDYNIKTLLRGIWTTEQFWSEYNRGTIVKSPVDLVIGSIRTTGLLPTWWRYIPSRLSELDQRLFDPPNVAGWPGGENWVTPGLISERQQIMEDLLSSPIASNGVEPSPTSSSPTDQPAPQIMSNSGSEHLPSDIALLSNVEVAEQSRIRQLRVAHVSYNWGERFSRNDNWVQFALSLWQPNSSGVRVEGMIFRLVVRNGGEVFFQLDETDCFPSCLSGPMPPAARMENSGGRRIELAVLGVERDYQRRQWNQLSENQKRFVSDLIVNFPALIEMAKSGQDWQQRNADPIYNSWTPILEQLAFALPRSRYATYASNLPVEVFLVESRLNEMSNGVSNWDMPAAIAGLSVTEANWINWVADLDASDIQSFFGFSTLTNSGTFDHVEYMLNPAFNLK